MRTLSFGHLTHPGNYLFFDVERSIHAQGELCPRQERNHMKKVLLLLVVLALTACSSTPEATFEKVVILDTPTAAARTYDRFDGSYFATNITVDTIPVVLQVEVETYSGSFDILITESENKDNVIDAYRDIQTGQYEITLSDPGMYDVWVEGSDHEGGFTIRWE